TAARRDSSPSLVFDTGVLRISNPFRLTCDSGETVDFSSIIGCCVSDACSTEQEFFIVFEGRITLRISLREEDFIGPEAASYQANAGSTPLAFTVLPEIVIIQ
ncbi:MAG TPA: hypothetical protein VIV27_02920, partial [Halioglobus sp.]